MTIKRKLILSFLSIAIIPMLVVELLSVYQAQNALETALIAELEVVADLKIQKIEAFFIERKGDIKVAQQYFNIKTSLPILNRLVNSPHPPEYIEAKKKLDDQLKTFQEVKGYIDVMLVNSEGKIVYVTNETHAGEDLDQPLPDPDGRSFEEGRKGIYFSDIFTNNVAGIPFGMLVTAPLHDLQGKFIGVIALEVDMDLIFQLIQDTTGLGDTGETLIVTKVDQAALFLNPLRHDKNAALKRRVPIGSENALPVQEAVLGLSGSGLSIDYRGEEVIAAWRYLPSLDWGLVAKIDIKEALALVSLLKKRVIIFVGIIFFMVTSLAFAFARSIARPIQSLYAGMEIVGAGDLDFRVGTDARDEIGQLSRVFDKMTENIGKISASRNALTQGIQESMKSLQKEVSEREKAEEKAQKSETRIRSVLDNATNGIITIDERGKIETFNHAAEDMFGYTAEETIGRNIRILMPSPHRENHDGYLSRYIETGEAKIIGIGRETQGKRKDGSTFPIDLSVSKVDLGDHLIFTGIVRDITQRKQAEGKLHSLNNDLHNVNTKLQKEMAKREQIETELHMAQKLEAVGQLAAGIAHEINTPMQYLGDNVHFLKTAFDDYLELIGKYQQVCLALTQVPGHEAVLDEVKEAEETADLPYLKDHLPQSFERTFEGIERVSTIVKAMKDFSHPDQREKTSTDINKGLTSTLTVARNEYKYVAEVETELGDIPPVMCHAGEINQVFLNIIVNASHAIGDVVKESQTKGKILIRTEVEKEDSVLITIKDSGGGIPEEIRQRVFDPFFTTKAVGRGTGQGLAIARSTIADKHGGSLTLESEIGQGTTFFIRLPINGNNIKNGENGA